MIVGYLGSDGKIYDRNGRFIKELRLEEDEEIMEKDDKFYCGGMSEKVAFGDSVFERGYTEVVRTSARLIFIREMRAMEKFSNHPFFGAALLAAMRAKEIASLGFREYLEIPLEEINEAKKRITGARNLIMNADGIEYIMVFPKSKKGTLEELFGK